MNVELLGINQKDGYNPAANEQFSYGMSLPWLQDTLAENVWGKWMVKYRDVVILDSSNRVVGIYNLSFNDLGVEQNRNDLKDMLRAAANSGDSDGDQLPDHWEHRYLGDLTGRGEEDADGDEVTNFLELALGSDPRNGTEAPVVRLRFNASKQFAVTYQRWAGSVGDYLAEGSTNLVQWTNSSSLLRTTTTTLHDGTGRSETTTVLSRSSATHPRGFLRLNVQARSNALNARSGKREKD